MGFRVLLCLVTCAFSACGDAATEPGADVAMDVVHDIPVELVTPAPACTTDGVGPAWTFDALATNGPFLAGYLDFVAIDPSRPTAAHGIVPETPSRTLSVRVWYPATRPLGDLTPALLAPLARESGPFPLLVHSHGFSSNKDELSYAATWLASRGWVVAAVEFPLTNLQTVGGPQMLDVTNQPADVRFVLDDLLARSQVSTDPLFGGIDAERVALSGVSLGGLTALLATYHRDQHDPRVRALIDIAGPTGFFTATFYSYVSVPALLVYGDTDAIVDYAAHALPARSRAPAGSQLLTLVHASHTGFANAASLFETLDNPDSVGCDAIAGRVPEGSGFLAELADPALGIEAVELPAPCLLDPLPLAMRPSRQQLLTRLALYAWLELQLGATSERRATACQFLTETLASESDVELR